MTLYTMDNFSEFEIQEIIDKVLENYKKNDGFIYFKDTEFYTGLLFALNDYLTTLSNGKIISVNWMDDEDRYFISSKRVYCNEKSSGFDKWIKDYAKRVFHVNPDEMFDDLDSYINIIYQSDEE